MKIETKFLTQSKSINVLEPRSYYIPYAKTDNCDNRYNSSFVTCLNGKWKITAFNSVYDIENTSIKTKYTGKINVPSCVQMFGYDKLQYINIKYPIPFNPPFLPTNNPAFIYTKEFVLSKKSEKEYIIFDGVDSCLYIYK